MLGRLGRKAFGGNLSDEKASREARDELLEGTLLAEVTTGTKARRCEQSQRWRTDRSSIYWLKMKRLWSRSQGKAGIIQGLVEPNNFHFIPTTWGQVEGYQLIWNQLIWWWCNEHMKDSGDILNTTTQTETQPYTHQLSEGGEIWPFREQAGSQTFKVNINFHWNQWEKPDGKGGHR